MATLTLDDNISLYQIRAYQPGLIRIQTNEMINDYHQSLIILPDQLIEKWPPQQFAALNPDVFKIFLTLNIDILLLGTGEHLQFPPLDYYGFLINAGTGVEVMNTAAACRTFNALSAENRKVAAGLLIA